MKVKHIFDSIYYNIQSKFKKLYERLYFKSIRKRLNNKDFSLFAPNCYAGLIYHRLGLEFLSPTINMFFPSKKQYLKFVSNLKHYLSADLIEYKDEKFDCPVGILDDIKLVFNHSNSFDEAKASWDRRKVRVNYDNVFIIYDDCVDSEYDDLIEFNKIQCKNKVIFTAKKYDNVKNVIQIKKYANDQVMKPYLLDKNKWTGLTPADACFDFVSWLNCEKYY
jgi:uncharacterized protein (DUF1919 family)